MTARDFISDYAGYADVLEAPRILHEIVAMQLVAATLNRNGVSIPLGAVRYSLDLWALLLSGSGAGRSTTIALFTPILEAADMGDLESPVRWGSEPSFYQHFAENPFGLHVWGEMAERLKSLNTPQFATAKEWLTDRFDNFKTPQTLVYRRTGKEQDTPPIEFRQTPRINILATSSDDWFFRNLAETDSAGGFLARWLMVRSEEKRRDVPVPQAPNANLVAPLAERLKKIGGLKGEADLSAILEAYEEQWYGEAKGRFEKQPNSALARIYFNRHRGLILKLAVIFEASLTGTLKVSPEAWKQAVEFAGHVERTIFELLPTGMNAVGYNLKRIEECIKRAGPGGLAKNEFTRAFQSMKPYEREQAIETLRASGTIRSGVVRTPGRDKTVYVHESFSEAQKAGPISQHVCGTPASAGEESEEVPSLEEFAEYTDSLTEGSVR